MKEGPATNRELAAISLKYTSRMSDIRKGGYDVRVKERDAASGHTLYELARPA